MSIPQKIKLGAIFVLMIGVELSLHAQLVHDLPDTMRFLGSVSQVEVGVDWASYECTITVYGTPRQDEKNRLSQVMRQEAELRSLFQLYIPIALDPIQVDSKKTVRTYSREASSFELALKDLALDFGLIRSQPSRDLKKVLVQWSLPLFPHLHKMVSTNKNLQQMPVTPLAWKPEIPMSSIVIFAEETLPWYGMNQNTRLQPCLYPVIYDESINRFFSALNMKPESVAQYGVVHYVSETWIRNARGVLGPNPYIARARSIFGVVGTDPVISNEDAENIYNSKDGRKHLADGNIFIVIPELAIKSTFSFDP